MGIFKNIFKNDEDTLSIISTEMVTDKINAKTFELANKLKSMLLAIGCTNGYIILNGIKIVIMEHYRGENNDVEIFHNIGILFKDDEKVKILDIDKPFTSYNPVSGKMICFPRPLE